MYLMVGVNPIVCFKRGNTLGQLVGDAHDDGVIGPTVLCRERLVIYKG